MEKIVQARQGKLRGYAYDGVSTFKGVRYAAAPFGANHMQPPQPAAAWSGVREALEFGPKSPQTIYPAGIAEALAEVVGTGEDCLNLNIWAPDTGAAAAPVMVWIPGGMFEFHATGGAAYYDGGRFARDGVVCVTISHRVGAEGFLYLDDRFANLGLLDQITALEWVRDNIAAFGGDPGEVTVFGQSAGAMSAATLMAIPRARSLFRRAIIQSGNTPKVNTHATAQRIARRLTELLRVEHRRAAVAALDPAVIIAAQARLREEMQANPDPQLWGEAALSGLPWAPTVDGDVLPQAPIDAIRAGAAADIEVIVGSNLDETRTFLLLGGFLDAITDQALLAMAALYGLTSAGVQAYRDSMPGATPGDIYSAIQTDWYWRIPAVGFADAHAASASAATHMYEFAWPSPQGGGRLGAAHGCEMAFVFDTLGLGIEAMLGPNPPQALADAMHGAWVQFAKTGDCGWPAYKPDRRLTMRFDAVSKVVEDPLGPRMDIWRRWARPLK